MRKNKNDMLYECECTVWKETDRAWRVTLESKAGATSPGVWLPKSACEWHPQAENPLVGTMVIPHWLIANNFLEDFVQ